MRNEQERGDPKTEHLAGQRQVRMPNWNSLWMMLELQRWGSFRAAAPRIGMSFNALRRHIEELEQELGVSLLTRGVTGIRMTAEGEAIIEAAKRMETAAYQVLRTRDSLAGEIEGEVKVAVTEGLGSAWLIPRIVEFQQEHPALRIDLSCGMTSADVLRMEADLAVQLTRPEEPDLKVVRLGYLHTMPFAAQSYVDRNGLPATPADLSRHTIVLQIAEQTATLALYSKTLPDLPSPPFVALKTNVSSAHTLAVANGAGIGWLPTYVSALGTGLIPVECGLNFRLDVWLTYHPDNDRVPRVRAAIDWIRACFDTRAFPFFGEEFVHPRDLPLMGKYEMLAKTYSGFVL